MEIPKQLHEDNFRFCLIYSKSKKPFESGWTETANYKHDDAKLKEWITNGENYGVCTGFGNLVVIDADREELRQLVDKYLPKTFTVKTGNGGYHYYFIVIEGMDKVIVQKNNVHYGEVQSKGQQVVGARSIHPNGNIYEIVNDLPIEEIRLEHLRIAIKDLLDEDIREIDAIKHEHKKINKNLTDLIDTSSFVQRRDELQGCHPIHDSENGMNFAINTTDNIWHCFRHNSGGSVLQWIAVNEGIIKCEEARSGCLTGEKFRKTVNIAVNKYGINNDIVTAFAGNGTQKIFANSIFESSENFLVMADNFINIQPIYYDMAKNWWIWNEQLYCWDRTDEVNIMNIIDHMIGNNGKTTRSDVKNEILEALRRKARLSQPMELNKTWIQFKDKIVDYEKNEVFEATPKFFAVNPIEWSIGDSEDTPIIDKLLEEWVGKDNIKVMHEIIAYCLSNDYFIQRIFCFLGSGNNGKTTFLNMLEKFIGVRNCCSVELEDILKNRFAPAKLYKRLVCTMGETNFDVITKSSILKKITGQDNISVEFKNKDIFDAKNYAKVLVSTNTLPATTDTSIGYYRRWTIIDFNKNFEGREKINVIENIPSVEFNNMARKCIRILGELRQKPAFSGEGSINDRKIRYEEKSNPVKKFIQENFIEEPTHYVEFWEFYSELIAFIKSKGHREMTKSEVGRVLATLGYEKDKKRIRGYDNEDVIRVVINGLKRKSVTDVTDVTTISSHIIRIGINRKDGYIEQHQLQSPLEIGVNVQKDVGMCGNCRATGVVFDTDIKDPYKDGNMKMCIECINLENERRNKHSDKP